MKTKFAAICMAILCSISLSGQNSSSLFGLKNVASPALQDGTEVFMGTGFRYYDFDFGKKMQYNSMLFAGIRFAFFEDFLFLSSDFGFGFSQDYRNYLSGLNMEITTLKFSKSSLYLGMRYQVDFLFPENENIPDLDKAQSLGAVVRFKNRAWGLEAHYGFGLNKEMNYKGNKEHLGVFTLRASVNLPVGNNR